MIDVGAEAAPRSAHDAFVLSAARARAGSILTTGANVRAEPLLRHEPFGPGAEALRKWRRTRITGGTVIPPHTVVLTRDASLDLGHPLFSDGDGTAHVLTDRATAVCLRRQKHHGGMGSDGQHPMHIIELHGRAATNPASPIVFARSLPAGKHAAASRLAHTVSAATSDVPRAGRQPAGDVVLECGVTTARPLYVASAVDELLLSVYHGPLDNSARGKTFLSWAEIREYFGEEEVRRALAQKYCVHSQNDQWQDGVAESWSFLRFRFNRSCGS